MSNLVIVGGGFAGVWAAMSAASERRRQGGDAIEISLVSRDEFLTIRPRLYETLSDDLRVPLAPLLAEIGVSLVISTARKLDHEKKIVRCEDGGEIPYDRLVLATGSELAVPNIPGAEFAFDVDTWAQAEALDKHYERLSNDSSFVVVGASFTGFEIATELRSRFGPEARIVLIDRNVDATSALGSNPAPFIDEALRMSNIETRFGHNIKAITRTGIILDKEEFVPSETVILASGLRASSLTGDLPVKRDDAGRLKVKSDLKVPGMPCIYAAGDTACALTDGRHETLMSCQHAIQLGRFAGHNAVNDMLGLEGLSYKQEVYATCLDLGPWGALYSNGWQREVKATGDAGQKIKRQIVTEFIYPPSPGIGADEIFKTISLSDLSEMAAS